VLDVLYSTYEKNAIKVLNIRGVLSKDELLVQPERHAKRQVTQHGSLPSFLGDGDKGMEIVYGEEKIFCTGPSEVA
jgi:hypothetical protein